MCLERPGRVVAIDSTAPLPNTGLFGFAEVEVVCAVR
jgi:hypothetical protein